MYANIKNFTKTTRKTVEYDSSVHPSIPAGTFVTIDPVTSKAIPMTATYAGSGMFGIVFKGTEEQVVIETGKLDVVFGPSVIITDNWNTATTFHPGDSVNIEFAATAWLDAPSGADIVGHVVEVTAENYLVVDFRQS